jgi:hypothetical protein
MLYIYNLYNKIKIMHLCNIHPYNCELKSKKNTNN